jgi:hypothetical protein
MEPGWSDSSALVTIKLLHTLIWFFFVCCIVALPVLGMRRRFRWAAAVGTIVTIECVIVALNDFRCPLTNVAARYTTGRAPNFDIYLPVWLAANNQRIFGTLFAAGALFVLWKWAWSRRQSTRN